MKEVETNHKKNIYFPTGLRFENKYPETYLYKPPESLKKLGEFFTEDKENTQNKKDKKSK
ncbi:MAG: hypothetical protein ACFFDF_23705 [Candidatus Odinarchaeota archaeon]